MIQKLKFFLRLQIKQTPNGIYIHQTKYIRVVEEIKQERCKRNEDSHASYNIPWTRQGINKAGWDSIQSND